MFLIEKDKDLNFRIYLFFKIRRLDNEYSDASVFSLKTLSKFMGLPGGTLNHLVKARRLLSNKNLYITEGYLKKFFGFNPNRKLTEEELLTKEQIELFN